MSSPSATTTAPASSAAAPSPAADGPGAVMTQREILLVVIALMCGMFLSALDQTIVSTAIRTIGDDLHGLNQQAWVTTAYLIASTISTPIYGKLSDLFGRRPLYIFGIGTFLLGSLLSSFSTSMAMLAAFRGVQGIGAGALMSLPLAIMGDMLSPRERAKYQGFFLAVFGTSSVIGPLIGGLFAGTPHILWIAGWRWVFLINVPIGIVALGMVLRFLHLPRFGEHKHPRIDWFGAAAVIVTLVPALLVAEQGRDWGWDSATAITCYVVSAIGLIAFLIIERRMGADAIIPMTLFRSYTFSMATILGFLVGFAMFGAMLTLPLYLQIVKGLTPTESGFATLPMVGGMMLASIVSGIIISRTGRYRIFPVTGTFLTACGYVVLTFVRVDSPLWFVMIGMFLIGLGLGQLMQTLTLASQSSVEPRDMGVATSASTFFRQIGGTMGVAILLSILFGAMPNNIVKAMENESDLKAALGAALDPAVAGKAENKGVMDQMWDPMLTPIKSSIASNLSTATDKVHAGVKDGVTAKVSQGVNQQIAAGRVPAQMKSRIVSQQVDKILPQATDEAMTQAAAKAHASVKDGKLAVDWSDTSQRDYWVDQLAPKISDKIKDGSSDAKKSSNSSTSDTSFLSGADARLTRPFMVGFNTSATAIYWVGLGVILFAFVLSWFFKVPPLRQVSALQQQADDHHAATKAAAAEADDEGMDREEFENSAVLIAEATGSPTTPTTGSIPQIREDGEGIAHPSAAEAATHRAEAPEGESPDATARKATHRAEAREATTHGTADAAAARTSTHRAGTGNTHRGEPDGR